MNIITALPILSEKKHPVWNTPAQTEAWVSKTGCESFGLVPLEDIPKSKHKAFPDIAQKPSYAPDYVK